MDIEFQSHVGEIPEVIIVSFKGLQNPFRIKVVMFLRESAYLSLAELQKLTNKPTGYLVKNIHDLELAGIVSNFIKKSPGRKDYSFYKLTLFGKNFVEKIDEFLEKNGNFRKQDKIDYIALLSKGLSNKSRFKFLLILFEQERSFRELGELTRRSKSSLTNHLHKLEKALLIKNVYRKDKNSRDYSFYKITEFGRDFSKCVIEAYNHFYLKGGDSEKSLLTPKEELSPKFPHFIADPKQQA